MRRDMSLALLSDTELDRVFGGTCGCGDDKDHGAVVIKEEKKEKGDSRVDVICLPNGRSVEPGRD